MRQNIIFLLFGLCITNIVKSQCTYYSRISGGKDYPLIPSGLKRMERHGAGVQTDRANAVMVIYNTSYQQIQIGTTADWADLQQGRFIVLALKLMVHFGHGDIMLMASWVLAPIPETMHPYR